MSGPANVASTALTELTKSATHAKGGLTELASGFLKVVEPAEVMKGAFEGALGGLKGFAAGAQSGEVKEMIGGIAESLAGLATLLDLVVPGLGQAASAVIKIGGAFGAMSGGLIQESMAMAIEATQGKQALIGMFGALGGGLEVGKETEEMLGDLSNQIGVTKDSLAPFTKAFSAMGIEGVDNLKKITTAAMSAQAIMGDPAAANAFEKLERKIQTAVQTGAGLKIPAKGLGSLADMGLRVDDVAQRMGVSSAALAGQLKTGSVNAKLFGDALQDALIDKGKGPLDRMSNSLGNIKKMFGQNIEDMFEDMGDSIGPFLAQVKDMLGIFSQSTESGKAMKTGIGGALSYMFAQATRVVPYVKHFLLDVVIYSLKGYIAARPLIDAFGELSDHSAGILTLDGAMKGLAANMTAIGEEVLFTIDAINSMLDAWKAIGRWKDEAIGAGAGLVSGLVQGITDGVTSVAAAAGNLGKSAIGAIRGVLDMHSPSRVAFQLGQMTGEPFASGIEVSAPDAAKAGAKLAASAGGSMSPDFSGAVSGAGGGGGDSAGGGRVLKFGDISIHITAPAGVTHALELTEAAIALIFERYALHEGV